MNVNITIQAPELVSAIQALAHSITGNQLIAAATPQAVPTFTPQPAAVPPFTPVPAQTVQDYYQQPPQIVPPVPPTYQPEQAVPVTPSAAPPVVPGAVPGVNPGAVPTEAPTYSIDQLAVAATQLVDAGRREELVQLLSAFGVQALTALPKEQFGAFATHLRAMGAKI